MKHINLFEKFISDNVEDILEKEKKEEKKQEEEEKKQEEETDEKLTPSSSLDYVKSYMKSQKMFMKDEDKQKFQELIEVLKDFIKERKELGRKY